MGAQQIARGHLKLEGREILERGPSPRQADGAASRILPCSLSFMHSPFVWNYLNGRFHGSFMLMYQTKATACGRGPRKVPGGRTRPGGAAGGRAARVSRVPPGLTQQLLIPANTKPLQVSGLALPRAQGRGTLWVWAAGTGGGNALFQQGRGSWRGKAVHGARVGFLCEARRGVVREWRETP